MNESYNGIEIQVSINRVLRFVPSNVPLFIEIGVTNGKTAEQFYELLGEEVVSVARSLARADVTLSEFKSKVLKIHKRIKACGQTIKIQGSFTPESWERLNSGKLELEQYEKGLRVEDFVKDLLEFCDYINS